MYTYMNVCGYTGYLTTFELIAGSKEHWQPLRLLLIRWEMSRIFTQLKTIKDVASSFTTQTVERKGGTGRKGVRLSCVAIGWAHQEVQRMSSCHLTSTQALQLPESERQQRKKSFNMAPKVQFPNAAVTVWLLFSSLIPPAEAYDAGDALALLLGTTLTVVGFCACLGWYARRRNGLLWWRWLFSLVFSFSSCTCGRQGVSSVFPHMTKNVPYRSWTSTGTTWSWSWWRKTPRKWEKVNWDYGPNAAAVISDARSCIWCIIFPASHNHCDGLLYAFNTFCFQSTISRLCRKGD